MLNTITRFSLAGIMSTYGPALLQIGPATVLGIEIYFAISAKLLGSALALTSSAWFFSVVVGVCAAIGLEFVGGSLSHTTVKAYWLGYRDIRLILPLAGTVIYVIIAVSIIFVLEEDSARMLGLVILLTPFAWFGHSLWKQMSADEQSQAEERNRDAHSDQMAYDERQARREQELALSEEETKKLRARARAAVRGVSLEGNITPLPQEKRPWTKQRFLIAARAGEIDFTLTPSERVTLYEVSDRTIRKWLEAAKTEGLTS